MAPRIAPWRSRSEKHHSLIRVSIDPKDAKVASGTTNVVRTTSQSEMPSTATW